jgi:hypothetical protein
VKLLDQLPDITPSKYSEMLRARNEVVQRNASRRKRGLSVLPLPDKPEKPLCYVAYSDDGTYEGRLKSRSLAEAREEAPGFKIVVEEWVNETY